jgi:hypothetical protein
MNEKYVFGSIAVIVALFVTVSMANSLLVGSSPISGASLTYNTMVCKVVTREGGEVVDLGCSHNLVTNDGKDYLKECLGTGGCSSPAFITLAIANCTNGIAAGDTSLCNGEAYSSCGLGPGDPTSGPTYASYGTGAWNVTATWTATCDNLPVNATGLLNATSGGTLFAENEFASVDLQTNDQINVTWGIWVT